MPISWGGARGGLAVSRQSALAVPLVASGYEATGSLMVPGQPETLDTRLKHIRDRTGGRSSGLDGHIVSLVIFLDLLKKAGTKNRGKRFLCRLLIRTLNPNGMVYAPQESTFTRY